MTRGGRRLGAGSKATWKHGKTRTIRVPEVLAEQILDIARKLDEGLLPMTNWDEGLSPLPAQKTEAIIERDTESKVIDLSGISIRACNGKSSVYLEDLAKAGYKILPERLGQMFKAILGNDLRK